MDAKRRKQLYYESKYFLELICSCNQEFKADLNDFIEEVNAIPESKIEVAPPMWIAAAIARTLTDIEDMCPAWRIGNNRTWLFRKDGVFLINEDTRDMYISLGYNQEKYNSMKGEFMAEPVEFVKNTYDLINSITNFNNTYLV